MNDTAQIILSVATLVTAFGTIILGLVNRRDIVKVREQTNGLMAKMEMSAEARGNLQGRADEVQYQRDNPPPGLHSDDPVKVEITKYPPLKK